MAKVGSVTMGPGDERNTLPPFTIKEEVEKAAGQQLCIVLRPMLHCIV